MPNPTQAAPAPPDAAASSSSELVMFLRWILGCVLVLVCGWGLIALAGYLSYGPGQTWKVVVAIAAGCNLVLFVFLERNHWLSGFMGLPFKPDSPGWHSAVVLWLFGIVYLLFHSTRSDLAEAAAPETRARRSATPQSTDGFREIIETVVFVVVLVLLLKSFVAEAFVIPTGSMATTLWGYQKIVECPKCGYSFPVNCSEEAEKGNAVTGCICPNCRYEIDFARENIDPSCNTGDRVLVAKFFYDSQLVKPERLDVVVFKYPEHPQEGYVPMNYIKRLIGKPGETIGIYYGKLYVLEPGRLPERDVSDIRKEDLWREQNVDSNNVEAMRLLREGKFRIVRKPPNALLAMRRIVYDNDHQASDLVGVLPPRWAGVDGGDRPPWALDAPHGFAHTPRPGDETDWLRYRHILRQGPEPELITDFMGYNSKAIDRRGFIDYPTLAPNWVGDLMLECEVTVDKPEGELVLELSKGIDRFRARWDLSTGTCTLLRVMNDRESTLESKPTTLKQKGTYRLRFANVDERLTVWVDGRLPFSDGVTYEPPDELGPRKNDLEPASIGARGAAVKVHQLKLWRDTYYTQAPNSSPNSADAPEITRLLGDPDRLQSLHKFLSTPAEWKPLDDLPMRTIYVQPGHYLCLGDNSPESSDGRSWGLVPVRLLLGRALLVYYPFHRFGYIK
jgi:signal peptidase I